MTKIIMGDTGKYTYRKGCTKLLLDYAVLGLVVDLRFGGVGNIGYCLLVCQRGCKKEDGEVQRMV